MPLQLSKVETTRLVQYPNPPPKPPLAPHCLVDRRFRKPTDVALERRFSVRRSADELRRLQRDLQEHEAALLALGRLLVLPLVAFAHFTLGQ
jgi:hypothetical protein